MIPPTFERRSHLPRLPAEHYRGRAFVHWTMTVARRETGWLDARFHSRFREILLHTLARYQLACPVYCLMPDHLHMVWGGLAGTSDQRRAACFFRTHLNVLLKSRELQLQAYDHVLRADERLHESFATICEYILANPVRAGLCDHWQAHPYSDALVVGYPDLDVRQPGYWEVFWRIYNRLVDG